MACVGEGDARALSVGRRWCGSDDPFRIDDDGLIVRLRNCTNGMRDPPCRARERARGAVYRIFNNLMTKDCLATRLG